ncbi:MAG: hypothetical protein KAT15_31825, partial [Bacteroidales bacterium]|nr:hypothetical protein [Bacteroidales bacterium]
MTEKQKSQVSVQKAVKALMDKNQAKWQAITELKNNYGQFTQNLERIDEYVAILQTDLSPLKEKKVKSRKSLIEKVFPVSSVMGVFASDIGASKLGKLAGVKSGELEKMSIGSLLKYCRRILKISESLLEQSREEDKKAPNQLISDYGLTVKHLEALQRALDGCSIDAAEYASSRLGKKKGKVKLDRRIRENNELLKKKLDRMM